MGLVIFLCGAAIAAAESGASGPWRTIDDTTGKAMAMVRISEFTNVLSDHIEKVLDLDPDPDSDGSCTNCRDHRQNQPVVGMVLLSNLRKHGD